MAIYFKFKSVKDYDSVPVDGPFVSVAAFKQKVYKLKYKGKKNSGLCFGNDFDMVVINAQTNNCYDDNMLIPTNTRVLIQRVPGTRRHECINTTAIVVPGSQIPKSQTSTSSSSNKTCSTSVSTSGFGDISGCSSNSDGSKGTKLMNFPVELVCPLCDKPMRYATFTAKCCFNSFCDRCIRDHLFLSNMKCVCGATDMLADYLIPNITVRGLIDSMLESGFTIPQPQILPSTAAAISANFQRTLPQVSKSALELTAIVEAAAHEEVMQREVLCNEMGKKKRKRESFEDVGTERPISLQLV